MKLVQIYLVRGLPGSGKTTFANSLNVNGEKQIFSADNFFYTHVGERWVYRWNPDRVRDAHADCQRRVADTLQRSVEARRLYPRRQTDGRLTLIVTNTFSEGWELAPYLEMHDRIADSHMRAVTVLDLFDAGCSDQQLAARCTHGVSAEKIAKIRARWQHSLHNMDPRPPWERG